MKDLIFSAIIAIIPVVAHAQNVGIGTDSPQRKLELSNNYENFLRVHTFFGHSGIELTRDAQIAYGKRDWRIVNDYDFILETAASNITLNPKEILRLTPEGKMGIGVEDPATTLHLFGGNDASNAGGGFLTLGSIAGYNLVFDNNEILAREDGNASGLHIQAAGGNTHFAANGGAVTMGDVGTPARLNVENDDWQLYLQNDANGLNDWYIGATSDGWAAGDDQLIFAPNSNSSSAVLRLDDVLENDGTSAPVAITSSGTQRILMDGNEIDCTTGPLYINNNSTNHTILNPNGGYTGIGTSSPGLPLHIKTSAYPEIQIRLENYFGVHWSMGHDESADFVFKIGDEFRAGIDAGDGEYIQYSDRNLKDDIKPLANALDNIDKIGTYSYIMKGSKTKERSIGVIAQELEQAYPELVTVMDGHLAVAYGPLAAIALKGIQEF